MKANKIYPSVRALAKCTYVQPSMQARTHTHTHTLSSLSPAAAGFFPKMAATYLYVQNKYAPSRQNEILLMSGSGPNENKTVEK
jgi:hypothetical protein